MTGTFAYEEASVALWDLLVVILYLVIPWYACHCDFFPI